MGILLLSKPAAGGGFALIDEVHVWRSEKVPDLFIDEDIDMGGNVFIGSSDRVKVGTIAAPGFITKTLRIAAAQFVPSTDTSTWTVGAVWQPNQLNVLEKYTAAATLPKGATITKFSSRTFRNAAGDEVSNEYIRISDTGGETSLALITAAVGFQTTPFLIDELVGENSYMVVLKLKSTVAVTDARLIWIEFQYKIPDLGVAI